MKPRGSQTSAAERRPRGDATPNTSGRAALHRVGGALILLVSLIAVVALGRAADWFPLAYIVVGATSFAAYWHDKRQAVAGGWRVSESTLHTLDFLFGIIGGLLAQAAFRHKTRKTGFAVLTTMILLCHATLLFAVTTGLVPFVGR